MLSLFSKSFKTTERDEKSHAASRDDLPVSANMWQDGSCVSVSAHTEQKKERRFLKGKHFRGLFSSDCDEITSVVSDHPQMYQNSVSMVNIGMEKCSHRRKL